MASLITWKLSQAIRRVPTVLWPVILGLAILLLGAVTWKTPIHQFNLWRLGRNFQVIDEYHPLDSELLGKIRDLGNLFEDPSHPCGYVVGEVRATRYSQEQLRQMYSGHTIDSWNHRQHIPLRLYIYDQEGRPLTTAWKKWHAKLPQSFRISSRPYNIYAIFILWGDDPPYGDLRCG